MLFVYSNISTFHTNKMAAWYKTRLDRLKSKFAC